MPTINDTASLQFAYEGYKVEDEANKAADANTRYFGFTNRHGAWYIMQQVISGTTVAYRFVKGDSGYTTAWTARESQTYDYFYNIFK